MLRSLVAILVILAANLTAGGGATHAADHGVIAPYLGDDVSAVAYVDLGKIDLPAFVEEIARLNLVPENQLSEARKEAAVLQSAYGELLKRGARRAYALLRVSDITQGGPTWLVEVSEASQAKPVADWLAPLHEKAKALGDVAVVVPQALDVDGTLVIGAANADRLKMVKAARTNAPLPEAVAALAALGDADAGYVGFGDADSRRVIREMFPQAPAPFMEIDGKLLADELKWIGLTLKFPPDPTITVSVETARADVATVLEQAAEKALVLAKGFLLSDIVEGPPAHKARAVEMLPLMPLLKPRVEGSRIALTFGDDEQEKTFLQHMLPELLKGARTTAYRNERMNQFKQIALAMLNYESAKKTYPPAASYDAHGKPLLSWRVLVLPYLDEMELYKQFHLDEPWDSEHNRKLIAKMPQMYADPDLVIRMSIDEGHTTCVVPVGEGLVFEGREGMRLREIKDGTSNTVLVIEVEPERAVVWTKPEDWEVDMKNPLDGLKRTDRDWFTTAWCDGHVKILSNSIEPDQLRAMLTRDGREVVKNP
jgi:hypothetical protein